MKKIDHFYKNLDIEKLIGVLDNWTKPNLLHFLVDEVTKCVNGYNEINDEEVFFRTYLEDLLRSGELFINLKEYFSINSYLTLELATSENHSNDIWNQVYILYSKVDKKYRLMHINCQNRPPKYFISILDTITQHDIRRIKTTDKDGREYTVSPRDYYLQILDKHFEKEKNDHLKSTGEQLDCIKFPNWPHYYQGCGHFNLGKKYYEKNNKEALELEHIEKI
ncbi:hypothetical protein OAM18_05670 [Candidatus Pelagibacter sp.]|nr:hypothetical protein [Candidatus Pelagibacter sp.]